MYEPMLTLFVGLAFRSYLAETVLFFVALVIPDLLEIEVLYAFSDSISWRRSFTGLDAANWVLIASPNSYRFILASPSKSKRLRMPTISCLLARWPIERKKRLRFCLST